jgi:RNAse (barnase) inhibitor barstar
MSNINKRSANYYKSNDERLVFIDGNICDTLEKCYVTLVQQLSLPDYFGFNLDALEEVLSDLDWIGEEKIHVIILNVDEFLSNDLPRKEDFIDILTSSENKKIDVTILAKS